jgi:hypothetical protein
LEDSRGADGSARNNERVLTMRTMSGNLTLREIEERARAIKRRGRRLFSEGKFDQAAEQKAVLDLARLLAAKQKIEAAKAKKRRR